MGTGKASRGAIVAAALAPFLVLAFALVAFPATRYAFGYSPPSWLSQPVIPWAGVIAAILAALGLVTAVRARSWLPVLLVLPFAMWLVVAPAIPAWVVSISP